MSPISTTRACKAIPIIARVSRAASAARGAQQGGAWNARAGTLASSGAKGSDAARFLVTGRGGWDGYTLSSRAKVGGSGAAGLVVGYRDSSNYTVFRFAGKGQRAAVSRHASNWCVIATAKPASFGTSR